MEFSIPLSRGKVQCVDWGDDRYDWLIEEAISFPEGRHDDGIDALTGLFEQIGASSSSIIGAQPYERESLTED